MDNKTGALEQIMEYRKRRESTAEKIEDFDRKLGNAIGNIAKTDDGKFFLWWIMNTCRTFDTTFTGNSQQFFLEGAKSIGLLVFNKLIEEAPDIMVSMVKSGTR